MTNPEWLTRCYLIYHSVFRQEWIGRYGRMIPDIWAGIITYETIGCYRHALRIGEDYPPLPVGWDFERYLFDWIKGGGMEHVVDGGHSVVAPLQSQIDQQRVWAAAHWAMIKARDGV